MSTRCKSLYIDKDISESSNYCDIDHLLRQTKSHKTSFHVLAPCKGRILLEIVVLQNSSLKVHIIRAEFPKINFKESLETTIKINFTSSNAEKQMAPSSTFVSNTDFTFRYDEFCLFHKLAMNQRIMISVYGKDESNNLLLGSMSFGLRKLWDSGMISGWYYLLKDNIGIKKHLKVYQESIPRSITADVLNIHSATLSSELITVNLRRKSNEFGFTICGNQPPYIGKVESNSSAEDCKLQSGDVIVKIENLMVFSCSAKAIAQILRLYKDEVTITVYRSAKLKLPEESYPGTDNRSKSSIDFIKFQSKSGPISWLKKIKTKKISDKSNENLPKNNLISKLGYQLQEFKIDENPASLDHEAEKTNQFNVVDRLQYLGHIPSVRFSSQNKDVEYCSSLWLIEANNRIDVTVMLFPQFILITHVEPDGFYTVIKRPIMLNTIMYLSMPINSKYDLVIQYRIIGYSIETIHFQGDSIELLTSLLKDKSMKKKTEKIVT